MGAGRAAVGTYGPEGRYLVQPGGVSSRGEDRLLASEAEEGGSDSISALGTEVRGRGYSQVWGSPGEVAGKQSQPGTPASRSLVWNLSSVVLA